MITRTKDNKFKIETEEDSPAENNNSEENDANVHYDDNDENDEENKKHSERITKKNSSIYLNISYLEEVYSRNIKETLDLLSNVSHWKNVSSEHEIFRNLTLVLNTIKPDDLVNLPMQMYLAMVNNKTGEQLEQIGDLNLRSLLFCQLHRQVWTKHCGHFPCFLKEIDCNDCLRSGCRGYLVEVKVKPSPFQCEGVKRLLV